MAKEYFEYEHTIEVSILCRIVFWNVHCKNLTDHVCELARTTEADVLVLIECPVTVDTLLDSLKDRVDPSYVVPRSAKSSRFQCYCRRKALDLAEAHAGFRVSIRRMSFGAQGILLGLVHGPDPRNYDLSERQSFSQDLAAELRFLLEQEGHSRLVLIGDFNMNPYDRGMNLPRGLNALMTKECVKSGKRRSRGKDYDLYYNPMWSLFGDGNEGPAGTVYYRGSQGPYGWSMFDQVVINHSLVDTFEYVRILTQAGIHQLTDEKGRPNSKTASDHLPILVKLKDSK